MSKHWLGTYRHRIRGFAAPFLFVLQHDLVDSLTRVVAPVVQAGDGKATVLAPRITVEGVPHTIMLLDMTAVPIALLASKLSGVAVDEDAISSALDTVFRGYPVGLRR